jgi:hypothetical protein
MITLSARLFYHWSTPLRDRENPDGAGKISKFRGLLVSRKKHLYFISVSDILKHRYPLPPFGFGLIY